MEHNEYKRINLNNLMKKKLPQHQAKRNGQPGHLTTPYYRLYGRKFQKEELTSRLTHVSWSIKAK